MNTIIVHYSYSNLESFHNFLNQRVIVIGYVDVVSDSNECLCFSILLSIYKINKEIDMYILKQNVSSFKKFCKS